MTKKEKIFQPRLIKLVRHKVNTDCLHPRGEDKKLEVGGKRLLYEKEIWFRVEVICW